MQAAAEKTTTKTYRVVRQHRGGRRLIDGIWQDERVTVAVVATGLSRNEADRMAQEDARANNLRAGLPGYWLAVESE